MLKTKMFKFFYNALHKAVSLAGKSPIHVKEKNNSPSKTHK